MKSKWRAHTLAVVMALALPTAAQIEEGTLLPLDVGEERDTPAIADTTDTLSPALQQQFGAPRGPRKLKIIRRVYNYREQVGIALGMMAFVAVIFTTTQNWNPK